MGWSLKVGNLFGIDIKIHFTFLLILVWGALNYGGSAGPLYGVIVTLALFTLVFLHELGHSLAARAYGIPVKDITLLPIGGVARLERMPEKPVQELVVALAGPLVNVVLAGLLLPVVLALLVAQHTSFSLGLITEPGLPGLLFFLFTANVSLFIFNMIPAFPLDGGRVLRAVMGFFTSFERATQAAATVGRVLAIGLGLFALFTGQFFLALIAVFIFFVGGQEAQAVTARSVLRGVRVSQALSDNTVAITPHATVGQAASMMMTHRQPDFAVLDPASGQLMGVVTRQSVARAMEAGRWRSYVSDIMQQVGQVPVITLGATLDEAQEKLAQTSSHVAAVYDGLNFRGLLSVDDIARVFQFLSQGGSARRIGWSGAS